MASIASSTLLSAVTATGAGSALLTIPYVKSVHARLTGTGAISATINIYGTNANAASNGMLIGTLAPNGTTAANDGFTMDNAFLYFYADCTAISGTNATLTVDIGPYN